MNPWFEYGSPFFAGAFPYAHQPYAPPAPGLAYVQPQQYVQPQPYVQPQAIGSFVNPVNGFVNGWPAFQEPSTLRPIGFQPPIGGAAGLTPFPQLLTRIPTDDEIEELISEALDANPLLSSLGEPEVRCESGVVTLTGQVQHKQAKRLIGEVAWSVPGIMDVQNNLEIAGRRRTRAGLRKDVAQGPGSRK